MRDLEQPSHFMSFAPWDDFETQHAWNQLPDFPERSGRMRRHCEAFQPSTYDLVTEAP